MLRRSFNSSQGSQLGVALVGHLLRNLVSKRILQPLAVYEQVASSVAAGVPVVLSMYSWATGEGHAVVAYDAKEIDRERRTIYIADPNTPSFANETHDWTSPESSRIDFSGAGLNAWQYLLQGGTPSQQFRGPVNASGPVTLMAIPLSVIFAPVRTPLADLGMLSWMPGGLILLGGAATSSLSFGEKPPPFYSSHVQNLSGLRDVAGSEQGVGDTWLGPTSLEEFYGDGQKDAPGLFRLPLMEVAFEAYSRIGRFPDSLIHTFEGAGDLVWQAATDRYRYSLSGAMASGDSLTIGLRALATAEPLLALTGTGATTDLSVHWRDDERGVAVRTVLPVGAGVTSRVEALAFGRGVRIVPGADVAGQVVELFGADGVASPVRIGAVQARTDLLVQPTDPASPLGEHLVTRLSPDGALLGRSVVSPGR